MDYTPTLDAGTISAVRLAFQRARSGSRAWKGHQQGGRLDARQVYRSDASRDRDIFRDRIAASATKVNAYILLDGSASMQWPVDRDPNLPMTVWKDPNATGRPTIEAATDVVATLDAALRTITNVRLNVWLHNTNVRAEADINMVEVIRNGKGGQYLPHLPGMTGGGNGDGYAIQYMAERIKKDTRPDEVGLLIVVSDGLPSVWAQGTTFGSYHSAEGMQALQDFVFNAANDTRDMGIPVLSVALRPIPAQNSMYGADNVIPFDYLDGWSTLAIKFGAALGKTLAEAAKAKARGRRR
jgi:hypothetical protein